MRTIFKIMALFISQFYLSNNSFALDCSQKAFFYECYHQEFQRTFIFSNQLDLNLIQTFMDTLSTNDIENLPDIVDLGIELPKLKESYKLPQNNVWKLPALSMIDMASKGVDFIGSKKISDLAIDAQKINWQSFETKNPIITMYTERNSARFNQTTQTVNLINESINRGNFSDIEQLALHETYGMLGIDDGNYQRSIPSMMVIGNQLSGQEFIQLNSLQSLRTLPIATSFISEDKEEGGGLTGVEGGGDITTGSLKRHIMQAYRAKFPDASVPNILGVSYIRIVYKVASPLIGAIVSTFDNENDRYSVEIKKSIHDTWFELTESEKNEIAKEIIMRYQKDMIEFDEVMP